MSDNSTPPLPTYEVPIVRIKLGADRAAPQPDPLGRDRIGYADGLEPSDLWERGRGVWKAKLATVAEADLVLLVFDGQVVMVGSVEGVTFHEDRVAIEGRPLAGHPLTGGPDPIPNDSRNPIAYGTITTVPASTYPDLQRPYNDVLGDAVAVLSEALRWRRPVLHQVQQGRWEAHPTSTERGDWAEFVTLALAGAAANAGGIETALAGRGGSWEADGVRRLLTSTVGEDEEHLWAHRTEPVEITLHVHQLLTEYADIARAWTDALEDIETRQEAAAQAESELEHHDLLWWYDRTETGEFLPRDPNAPAWSWEAWRAQPRRDNGDGTFFAAVEESLRTGIGLFTGQSGDATRVALAKSPEAHQELWRLEDEHAARMDVLDDLAAQLEQQQLRALTAYGKSLKAHIETAAADIPGLAVPVRVTVDVANDWPLETPTMDSLEAQLLNDAAAVTTPPEPDLSAIRANG